MTFPEQGRPVDEVIEALRANGRAVVELSEADGTVVTEACLHCANAFRRSGLWGPSRTVQPESGWPTASFVRRPLT